MLLDCINERGRRKSEFVVCKGGYDEVRNVLSDLNSKFYNCVEARRSYDAALGAREQDAFHKYMMRDPTVMEGIVSSCTNGVWQDLMMAYAFADDICQADSVKIGRRFPMFRNLNCSPSCIFIDFDGYCKGHMLFELTKEDIEDCITPAMRESQRLGIEQNAAAVPIGKSRGEMALMRLRSTVDSVNRSLAERAQIEKDEIE